jgi:hypothetical protein
MVGVGMEQDRERVCNDMINTGVMAALIGGFALGNMNLGQNTDLERGIYMLCVVAVHGCTCSALTSALLYRQANRMPEEAVPEWAARRWWLLLMPILKFGMGCGCYLISVLLISYNQLGGTLAYFSVAVGVGSMSMGIMTATVLATETIPVVKGSSEAALVAPTTTMVQNFQDKDKWPQSDGT